MTLFLGYILYIIFLYEIILEAIELREDELSLQIYHLTLFLHFSYCAKINNMVHKCPQH